MSACGFINLVLFLVICLHVQCYIISIPIVIDWPDNEIPYIIKEGFSKDQVDHITEKVNQINNRTCVRWLEYDAMKHGGRLRVVKFVHKTSGNCHSELGYSYNYTGYNGTFDSNQLIPNNAINLLDYCFGDQWVIHEMLHQMGFKHEHSRTDRNCYVNVNTASVDEDPNFDIERDNNTWLERFPYDFYSVMHYRRSDRLKKKGEGLLEWADLGNPSGILTDLDVLKIKYRYCKHPHYCLSHAQECEDVDNWEKTSGCL